MINPADCVHDEPMGTDQYRHVESRAWSMHGVSAHLRRWEVLQEAVREEWVPADPASEWLLKGRYTGRRKWLRGSYRSAVAHGYGDAFADEPAWERRAPYGDYWAADAGRQPGRRRGWWQLPTPELFATLPRDPHLLLQRLRADSPGHRTPRRRRVLRFPRYVGPWTYALDALSSGLVPADLRAGVYRALQLLPQVRMAEDAATLDGAAAVALILDLSPVRHEVFVDPVDGQYVGKRETVTAWNPVSQVRPGTIVADEVVRASIVDGIDTPIRAA